MSFRTATGRSPLRPTTTAKVQIVLDVLQRLYPNPSVPLKRRDPYTHLIAVLLSAQCTDVRVNQVTPALFARADQPGRMVELAVEEIEQIIRPCGLAPRKSKAIWELSQILLAEHGGQVPPDLAALERLPGVGHKTAQVVLAQNFGVPTFPVDTHIHRLIYRWGLSTGQELRADRTGLQAPLPPRALERPAPANHLLWPRALPGAWAPAGRVPAVQQDRPQEP